MLFGAKHDARRNVKTLASRRDLESSRRWRRTWILPSKAPILLFLLLRSRVPHELTTQRLPFSSQRQGQHDTDDSIFHPTDHAARCNNKAPLYRYRDDTTNRTRSLLLNCLRVPLIIPRLIISCHSKHKRKMQMCR